MCLRICVCVFICVFMCLCACVRACGVFVCESAGKKKLLNTCAQCPIYSSLMLQLLKIRCTLFLSSSCLSLCTCVMSLSVHGCVYVCVCESVSVCVCACVCVCVYGCACLSLALSLSLFPLFSLSLSLSLSLSFSLSPLSLLCLPLSPCLTCSLSTAFGTSLVQFFSFLLRGHVVEKLYKFAVSDLYQIVPTFPIVSRKHTTFTSFAHEYACRHVRLCLRTCAPSWRKIINNTDP